MKDTSLQDLILYLEYTRSQQKRTEEYPDYNRDLAERMYWKFQNAINKIEEEITHRAEVIGLDLNQA